MTMMICLVDFLAPLWYDVWVLYLLPLFFMFQTAKRPYIFSTIVTLLIVAGLLVSHSDGTQLTHAATNRFTGILAGWGVSFLLMQLKRLQVAQIQASDELQSRVEERTSELSQTNDSLRKINDELIQAEEALRVSEKKYRDIFENTQDVFYLTDLSGTIRDISPSILRYSGYTREELLGKSTENFYHTMQDRMLFLDEMRKKPARLLIMKCA